jgi:hypothetical protein
MIVLLVVTILCVVAGRLPPSPCMRRLAQTRAVGNQGDRRGDRPLDRSGGSSTHGSNAASQRVSR